MWLFAIFVAIFWIKLKTDNEISEDEEKRYSEEVQKITDKAIADMDELLKAKEVEIKQV